MNVNYLNKDVRKFPVEKVDSHTYIVPNILKSFPITELSFKIKIN